jgi:hypothetical protein
MRNFELVSFYLYITNASHYQLKSDMPNNLLNTWDNNVQNSAKRMHKLPYVFLCKI